jgi:probable HAF family extracellular repeat protein
MRAALAVGFTLLLAGSAEARERSYTYVPIGTLGWGGKSIAEDVNADGVVAGWAGTSGGTAMRWQDGRMTSLGSLSKGGASGARAINDAGDIVGSTLPPSDFEPGHMFLYRDGKMTDLGKTLGGATPSSGKAINNAGWIVGDRLGVQTRGFLYRNGRFEDLGSLTGRPGETTAEDVNDRGQIVGSSVTAKGYPLHAFVWEDGRMRDLGVLGPDTESTQARAINEAGVVVGRSQGPSLKTEPMRWTANGIEALPTFGDGGDAVDINERGEIVGYARTPESPYLNQGHAVLWADGELHDLNALVKNLPDDVQLEGANAINDDGIIVGDTCSSYCDPGKTAPWHGFVLIPDGMPVPEPQPVLTDLSSSVRPVTVAGPAPTTAQGLWGDALRFAGGRLEVPHIELPLTHNVFAWLRPDRTAGEQVVMDIGGVARLAYDGTDERLTYTVLDGGGKAVTAATPPGSLPASAGTRFVAAGRATTGELVVAIAGITYCARDKLSAVARGDGVTPVTVGSAAGGARPFHGLIEYPGFGPNPISNADYRPTWWPFTGANQLLTVFYDADQRPGSLDYVTPPSVPETPCRIVEPPAPTPTPTATPEPTATPTPTPTPTPEPTATATPEPTPTATGMPSGWQTLSFVHSGQAVRVSGATDAPDAAIVQSPTTDDPAAQWKLEPTGDRGFAIVNRRSDRCLAVMSSAPGPLRQQPCDGSLDQRWAFMGVADGAAYRVVQSLASGMVINQSGATSDAGGAVIGWPHESGATNERLMLTPVQGPPPPPSGWMTLRFVHSGQAIAPGGEPGTIVQAPLDGDAREQWKLESTGDRGFTIVNRRSGQCLDITGPGPGPLRQAPCDESPGQRWTFDTVAPDASYHTIRNLSSGLVINQSGATVYPGAPVIQWPQSPGATNERIVMTLTTDARR